MKLLHAVFGSCVALCGPVAATAVPLPFTGAFTLRMGILPVINATGSGVGNFSGAGGAASIPAGVFSIRTTLAVSPPLLVIDGWAAGATGQKAKSAPFAPGSNKALTFGGITGKMALNASGYLLTGGAKNAAAALKIGQIGFGCFMATAFGACGGGIGLLMSSFMVNPYRLGMVTVMGALNGVPSTVMGTGFDNRTAGGQGVLQLVTPASVGLGALGSLASVATLTITIVPEPATAILFGCGILGLGLMRGRRGTR